MPTGTIKWYSTSKQFGFIVPDDGSRDVFLHQSALDTSRITTTPREGDRFSYDVEQKQKGPAAKNLKPL